MNETKTNKASGLLVLILFLGIAGYMMYDTPAQERELSELPVLEESIIPEVVKAHDFYNANTVKQNLQDSTKNKKAYVYAAYSLYDKWIPQGVDGYIVQATAYFNSSYFRNGSLGMEYFLHTGDLVKYGVATAQNQKHCGCNTPDFEKSVARRYSADLTFYNTHRFECVGLYYKPNAHGVEGYKKLMYFSHPDNDKRRKVGHILIHPPKR